VDLTNSGPWILHGLTAAVVAVQVVKMGIAHSRGGRKKGCVIGWWIVDLSGVSAQEWFVGSVIICPVRLATGIAGIVSG